MTPVIPDDADPSADADSALEATGDDLVLAQPSSARARAMLAALAAFTIAGVLTWTPILPPLGLERVLYFGGVALVLGLGAILPLYAALTGADSTWRLRDDRLTIELRGIIWRRRTQMTSGDIASLAVDLAPGHGPERVAVVLVLKSGARLISPPFDDPLDAETFAEALADAFDIAAPASYLPPGMMPRRRWPPMPTGRPTRGARESGGS